MIKDCLKGVEFNHFYFPGGCYRLDVEKAWTDYPGLFITESQSKISLLGVYSIKKKRKRI